MKYKCRKIRKCFKKGNNKDTMNPLKINNRFKNRKRISNKHKRVSISPVREAGPTRYIFYAVLNTDVHMTRGTAAANIANGLMSLHSKLDTDQVKSQYIDDWTRNGQKIIVLKGYDHKHLKFLNEEVKFVALGTQVVRQSWGRNRAIIVLAVFGRKEDLEEVFEGLSYLR